MANVETWARGGKRRGSRRAFERSRGGIPLFLRTDRILFRGGHTTASKKDSAVSRVSERLIQIKPVEPRPLPRMGQGEMQGVFVFAPHT